MKKKNKKSKKALAKKKKLTLTQKIEKAVKAKTDAFKQAQMEKIKAAAEKWWQQRRARKKEEAAALRLPSRKDSLATLRLQSGKDGAALRIPLTKAWREERRQLKLKKRRRRRRIILGVALGVGALAAAVHAVLKEIYKFAFVRGGSPILNKTNKKTHAEDYYLARDGAAQTLREEKRLKVTLPTPDGEILTGFFYPADPEDKLEPRAGRRIVYLVHGYHSEHAETAGLFREMYRRLGFDLFTADQRAHGESSGTQIGFGATEQEDCLLWLNFLKERFGEDIEVMLHGFSMGAHTVLCVSDRVGPEVRAIVEDSGYASAATLLVKSLGPLYPLMQKMAKGRGVNLKRADALPHLWKAKLPILFVHGKLDPTVPYVNGPLLYKYYRGPKSCLFTEDTKHIEMIYSHPQQYEEELKKLIAAYF